MDTLGVPNVVLLLATCHFIGDFAFQSAWMAAEKGRNFEVLLYHSATYTAPFGLMLVLLSVLTPYTPSVLSAVLLFGSHALIDTLSARLKIIKTIWADQLCHFAVIGLLLVLRWI